MLEIGVVGYGGGGYRCVSEDIKSGLGGCCLTAFGQRKR
jgi:hypothetical protein